MDAAEAELIEKGRVKINGVPIKFGKDEKGNPRLQRIPFSNLLVPELQALINGALIAPIVSLIEDGRGVLSQDNDYIHDHCPHREPDRRR